VTLILSTGDAEQVLDISSVIACLEETYAGLGSGSVVN
jgi:hypothetical protein